MPTVPEELLQDIASRVYRRAAGGAGGAEALPARYTLLALSGEGSGLVETLKHLTASRACAVAVADCPTASAGAVASALARVPGLHVVSGEQAFETDALVARAERVVAPSMSLALASRVASLHVDTPASRAITRALLRGLPVEASLDECEFAVSDAASPGTRRAIAEVESRLGELGIALRLAPAACVAGAAATPHPSQERFELDEPLNEFIDFLENRPCMIEPGKPCIGCGACETRGF